VTGSIEMRIWAEFVGVDGIVARREIFVVRRDIDQPKIKDFGLTFGRGQERLVAGAAEQTQFQVEEF
jgi:hypothetical protein